MRGHRHAEQQHDEKNKQPIAGAGHESDPQKM